ncbi:GNAT family N-acetyltransferase [Mucilaginibacter sp.]|uniref:GNAT family N-acetyltransferase n=1 Tax=Mucilaginibacter sp. TaxID=1882438 RepID=UPI0025E56234|nr:GNAT family N-acetyltransferase [Mucilaginibacter sp.]
MPTPEEYVVIEQTTDPADFATCAAIMSRTDPWITLGMGAEDCSKAFQGLYREVFVLRRGDEIAGFFIIQPQGSFKGYVQTIAVAEGYRGKGYGTRILKFCEDRILKYSPNIFICVSSFNPGALNLYTRFGFKKVGELKDFIKIGFTEILLRKTVGPAFDYKGSD